MKFYQITFIIFILVSALADKIVWNCLVEDAALFLRYFFEKITQKDKKVFIICTNKLNALFL